MCPLTQSEKIENNRRDKDEKQIFFIFGLRPQSDRTEIKNERQTKKFEIEEQN